MISSWLVEYSTIIFSYLYHLDGVKNVSKYLHFCYHFQQELQKHCGCVDSYSHLIVAVWPHTANSLLLCGLIQPLHCGCVASYSHLIVAVWPHTATSLWLCGLMQPPHCGFVASDSHPIVPVWPHTATSLWLYGLIQPPHCGCMASYSHLILQYVIIEIFVVPLYGTNLGTSN